MCQTNHQVQLSKLFFGNKNFKDGNQVIQEVTEDVDVCIQGNGQHYLSVQLFWGRFILLFRANNTI